MLITLITKTYPIETLNGVCDVIRATKCAVKIDIPVSKQKLKLVCLSSFQRLNFLI